MAEDQELVLTLDGGQFETSLEEVVPDGFLYLSQNTRLSMTPTGAPYKCPESTDIDSFVSTQRQGGIVAVGSQLDSSIVYTRGEQTRVAGAETKAVASTIATLTNDFQNAYWPVQVVATGTPFNSYLPHAPAVLEYNGFRFFAGVIAQANGNYAVYLSVQDTTGKLVLPQALVRDTGLAVSLVPHFVGLTNHPGSGVRIWYNRLGTIYCRSVQVSALTLTLGTETSIYTPNVASAAYQVSVCSGGTGYGDLNYAWLVCVNSANVNDVTVSRVDVNTYALSSVNIAGVGGADVRVAVAETNDVTSGSHLLVVLGNGAATSMRMYDGQTMGVRWAPKAGPAKADAVAASFQAEFGSFTAIGAFVDELGLIGTNTASTEFHCYAATTGLGSGSVTKNWIRLQSRGAFYRASATEIYPFFLMHQSWGSPGDLEDPALHVITLKPYGLGWSVTPLARLGVDQARLGGSGSLIGFFSHATSEPVYCDADGRLTVCYQTNRNPLAVSAVGDLSFQSKYTVLDFSQSGQCQYAIDDAGCALIAAAQPAYWDGTETVEIGPLHKPKVLAEVIGGTGPNLTGTYAFRVCYTWRDSFGELHRSEPSTSVSISPAGTKPRLWVADPFTLRDGRLQEQWDVEIYATASGSTEYVLQDYQKTSSTLGCSLYATIDDPAYSYKRRLYSTGVPNAELFPGAPGALHDIAIVGPRAWAIDAENRKRALYSKTKNNSAIFHEFNGALEVLFPASAGDLVGVEDGDGNPTFFTSTGIFQVYGDGPNNQGQGARFSAPRKISDFQCTSTESIVKTPVGVFFQCGSRFAILQGGTVKVLPEIDCDDLEVCQAVHFPDQDEVVFTVNFGITKVFNYAAMKWTQWDIGRNWVATVVPNTGAMLSILRASTATSSAGALQRLLPDGASSTTLRYMRLETGWLTPAGPQGTCTFRELFFQGYHHNAHGVTITVYYDYRSDVPTTVSWTASEIDALETNNRYTLGMRLVQGEARAIRIVITETEVNGSGMRPLSLTLCYAADPGAQRRSLREGALK